MDGIACALNKKCRESKSKEIVDNMNNEEKTYEAIYAKEEKKEVEETTTSEDVK